MNSLSSNDFITTSNDRIIDITLPEKNLEKIKLTQLDSPEITQHYSFWCFNSRNKRNCWRVTVAGTLSAIGAWVNGLYPTLAGILGGGIVSGTANGISAAFSRETQEYELIKSRILIDLPKVASKIEILNRNILTVTEQITTEQEDQSEFIIEANAKNFSASIEKPLPFYWSTRNIRNLLRIITAGGLSAAGGWLGGFHPSIPGVLIGGVIGGIGNALGTIFIFEKPNDELTRKIALERLSKILESLEKDEENLIILIEKIKQLNQKIKINFSNFDEENSSFESFYDEPSCGPIGKRVIRNFTYVSIAGLLSAAGGWITGFSSETYGILIGGAFSGVANSISTWFILEEAIDKKIEEIVLNNFPRIVLKVDLIANKILKLQEYLDNTVIIHPKP